MRRKHDSPCTSPWFTQLVEKHYRQVVRIAQIQLLDINCADMAEDVAQEVFFSAFLNQAILKTHPNVGGWLYQTAYKRCRNTSRRQNRQNNRCAFSLDDPEILEIEDVTLEDRLYRSLEEAYDLDVAIAYFQCRLSQEENQLFRERYIEKRTSKELSLQYGISEQAMSMRIYRLRKKICKILEKFFDEALKTQ